MRSGYENYSMPSRTVTMTLECAGNSRIFLSPKVGGPQWERRRRNAEWTGVPLAGEARRLRAGRSRSSRGRITA
jgi:DMSO/TMAO reductase YedYZ molybdopterin-dependent catalytic subunit